MQNLSNYIETKFSALLTLDTPKPIIALFKHYKALARGLYPVIPGMNELLEQPFLQHKNWISLLKGERDHSQTTFFLNKSTTHYQISIHLNYVDLYIVELFFDMISPYLMANNHEHIGIIRTEKDTYYELSYIERKIYAIRSENSLTKRLSA